MSLSKSWLQKEHIQEVVFLDTLEEQGYTKDQLVEDQEVAPFSLTKNKAELFHSCRYDKYDDDLFEQPISNTSSGSDSIYDDYASHPERNEEVDDVLSTSEWGMDYQNVAFSENTHLILDMINKENKEMTISSFHNDPKTKISAQEQLEVKEEAPLSISAHLGDHTHLPQTHSPFLRKESD